MPVRRAPQRRSAAKTTSSKKILSNPFQTVSHDRKYGKFILAYGKEGLGKTTWAAHAPSPLFVCTADELGIYSALDAKVVPPDLRNYIVELPPIAATDKIPAGGSPAWMVLMDTMDTFLSEEHDRRTLIVDTTSGLQPACHQHCASLLYGGDMTNQKEFLNYQEGYLQAAEKYWHGEFLQKCNQLISAGYNIILLAHCATMTVPNFGGIDYEQFAPALIKGAKKPNIYDYTVKTVSAILFFGQHTFMSAADKKTSRRSVSSQDNFIGTRSPGWYVAKNWHNIDKEIECGSSARESWKNFVEVLPID